MLNRSIRIRLILVLTVSLALISCEKSKVITGLEEFVVTVEPQSYELNDSNSLIQENYVDYKVTVKDENDNARNGVELYVDSPVMRVANGVFWFEFPVGSGIKVYNSIYPVTDDAGGVFIRVGFRHGGTISFSDDIQVYSGSAEIGSFTITVTSN